MIRETVSLAGLTASETQEFQKLERRAAQLQQMGNYALACVVIFLVGMGITYLAGYLFQLPEFSGSVHIPQKEYSQLGSKREVIAAHILKVQQTHLARAEIHEQKGKLSSDLIAYLVAQVDVRDRKTGTVELKQAAKLIRAGVIGKGANPSTLYLIEKHADGKIETAEARSYVEDLRSIREVSKLASSFFSILTVGFSGVSALLLGLGLVLRRRHARIVAACFSLAQPSKSLAKTSKEFEDA